ncbi:MAG: hypothetical protein GY796_29635 [Chloroflexi bacterium]|nr:hypothetical protein [Chloroflexota bacterium]
MKSYKNLYPQIYTWEDLENAYRKARKAVTYRRRLNKLWQGYRQGTVEQRKVVASIKGWLAHIHHGDSWRLAGQLLKPIVF